MAKKDWKGNKASSLVTMGARHNGSTIVPREENDFYATDPKALKLLLELEKFSPVIWECACGKGHLSDVLTEHGHHVFSSDIVNRGYKDASLIDFLHEPTLNISIDFLYSITKHTISKFDIITNPPYRYAEEFVTKALETVAEGQKVAMFLRIQFLESKKRALLFKKYPIKTIYVASGRIECAINGDFTGKPSAACYAWFIWEKGYKGETTVKFFN